MKMGIFNKHHYTTVQGNSDNPEENGEEWERLASTNEYDEEPDYSVAASCQRDRLPKFLVIVLITLTIGILAQLSSGKYHLKNSRVVATTPPSGSVPIADTVETPAVSNDVGQPYVDDNIKLNPNGNDVDEDYASEDSTEEYVSDNSYGSTAASTGEEPQDKEDETGIPPGKEKTSDNDKAKDPKESSQSSEVEVDSDSDEYYDDDVVNSNSEATGEYNDNNSTSESYYNDDGDDDDIATKSDEEIAADVENGLKEAEAMEKEAEDSIANEVGNDQKVIDSMKTESMQNTWELPSGKGVNLDRLNRCLEKHVRREYFNDKTSIYKNVDDLPLMDGLWKDFNHHYVKGKFGGFTTWAISESKKLAGMLIPKSGSMSIRSVLGRCDLVPDQPCDVLNRFGRPWKPEDDAMDFHHGFFKTGTRNVHGETKLVIQKEFKKAHDEAAIRFAFVTDPISKFIGAFTQVYPFEMNKDNSDKMDHHYRVKFAHVAEAYTSKNQGGVDWDIHFAPHFFFLYNAAVEATHIARRGPQGDLTIRYAPPFDFVGRMVRNHAQKDWEGLRGQLNKTHPEVIPYVSEELDHSNSAQKDVTVEDYRNAVKAGHRDNLVTLHRQVRWKIQHAKAKRALGRFAKPETMPPDLVRRFCATFYAEYVCFGHDFPSYCTDDHGKYNLSDTEYPRHIVQP